MPKREDERHAGLTGKHPVYCTCTQCTEKFLRQKGIRPGRSLIAKLVGRTGGEKVKAHPPGCACATCNLLRSVGDLPAVNASGPPAHGAPPARPGRKGILGRLLGRS